MVEIQHFAKSVLDQDIPNRWVGRCSGLYTGLLDRQPCLFAIFP